MRNPPDWHLLNEQCPEQFGLAIGPRPGKQATQMALAKADTRPLTDLPRLPFPAPSSWSQNPMLLTYARAARTMRSEDLGKSARVILPQAAPSSLGLG